MKTKRISIVASFVMLVILVSVVPATAQTERIDYTGTVCIDSLSGGYEWTSGNVYHQRDVVTSGVVISDSPYMAADAVIIQNLDWNLLTNDVHVYGTLEISPDAYDGTWVGHWSTHVYGAVELRGSSTAIGTGELEGMFDFNNMSSPANPNPACWQGGTDISGYIMILPRQ